MLALSISVGKCLNEPLHLANECDNHFTIDTQFADQS
jgi:hypothetical protein